MAKTKTLAAELAANSFAATQLKQARAEIKMLQIRVKNLMWDVKQEREAARNEPLPFVQLSWQSKSPSVQNVLPNWKLNLLP